jgi:transcription elongation factor SPT6
LLDCGMVAVVEEGAWTDLTDSMGLPRSPKHLFTLHQTVQAHITDVKPNEFSVTVSLKDDQLKKSYKRFDPKRLGYDEWDDKEEGKDRKLLEEKSDIAGRTTRVVKHPLFKPFNSKQAEEYLASQSRGDVVIRPSSKGTDHLAVTWKVADGVFQHIDVLELGKENEFALGKTLRIGGNQGSAKYTYSDLDELIVMHVKAMARKVEEMVANDKYQDKTKSQLGTFPTPLDKPCFC